MEEAARIISKAFTNCVTDRYATHGERHIFEGLRRIRQSAYAESRRWGVYYVVGLILKCYFRVRLSRFEVLLVVRTAECIRTITTDQTYLTIEKYSESNRSKPGYSTVISISAVASGWSIYSQNYRDTSHIYHQVTHRYYIGMLKFLSEEYAQVRRDIRFQETPYSEPDSRSKSLPKLSITAMWTRNAIKSMSISVCHASISNGSQTHPYVSHSLAHPARTFTHPSSPRPIPRSRRSLLAFPCRHPEG